MLSHLETHQMEKENSRRNTEAVMASQLQAKAVLQGPGGKVQIVAVFARSTRAEFYWVFEANSARSPRKKWRAIRQFACVLQIGPEPTYNDLASFLAYYAAPIKTILSTRILKPRKLKALISKQEHESIRFDWNRTQNLAGATFNIMNRKFHSKVKGAEGRWDEGWVVPAVKPTGD